MPHGCKRERDIRFLVRDETETQTSDFCHETRPRPCKAETFFETFEVEHGCTLKFPRSMASKSFLCSNEFMAKSGAQSHKL